MTTKIHIGMRKIKSVLAVGLSFVAWQGIRLFLPGLDIHPIFAYVYSISEIRESSEETRKFGKLRIRATLVGLVVGLLFIAMSVFITSKLDMNNLRLCVEFAVILIATLCSLCVAEILKCENFCGDASVITVICMVTHNEENIYLYAVMRVLQTLIGVFSATIINAFVMKRKRGILQESHNRN
ncbi:MAG: hypothetical protein IKI97_03895 [Clostridia bacterium]|nr:hypothetical protein [Clostridia bacterium]